MKSIALYYKSIDYNKSESIQVQRNELSRKKGDMPIHLQEQKEGCIGKNSKCSCSIGHSPEITELHVNIWKVECGHYRLHSELFFDFGIKTSFETKELCLYLPFEVSEVKDLGVHLNNQKELLSAIFNDDLLLETQSNDCFCKVKQINPEFYLYQLGNSNITTTSSEEIGETKGTFINMTIDGTPDHKVWDEEKKKELLYVRIRVKVKDKKQVVVTQHVSNDLLQAAFSMVDLYDIRINELRELHPKTIEKMNREGFKICTFEKVHLFYMADTREVIENGSSLKQDSRILEEQKWLGYEPHTDLHNSIFIAHHWKRRCDKKGELSMEQIKSFSLFFSTIYPNIQVLRLLVYMLFIIFLGWTGSMLSFEMNKISNNWLTWICPILVGLIIIILLVYLLTSAFGFKIGNIYRKR